MKDFARDRVLNIVNSSRTVMKVRRRSPPSSLLDARCRLVRRNKLLAPPLKLDRSRLALRLLLNHLEKQNGNAGRIVAGDEDGDSDKSSEACTLTPDHTRMRYIQSREKLFSLVAHTKKTRYWSWRIPRWTEANSACVERDPSTPQSLKA